jgi:hypothetical protein
MYSFFLTLSLTQYLLRKILHRFPSLPRAKNSNERPETEKVPILVIKRIRKAILKAGDHLGEVDLAEKFEVSRWAACERFSPWNKKARPL